MRVSRDATRPMKRASSGVARAKRSVIRRTRSSAERAAATAANPLATSPTVRVDSRVDPASTSDAASPKSEWRR
jgi:hypothetical protein